MSWKKVKLGDLLTESKIISENPNPDRRITVRLKVLGVEKRGLENEVEGATKQYIRKAGQFIYGKQNFHKGAFGIVPSELDGFESSSDIPSFDIDKSCLPEYIFYFFKQGNFYFELSKIASGVATQRINTIQLFDIDFLLPDINTQRKLISEIQLLEKNGTEISNELTYQLNLVKKLRQQLLQDAVQGKLVEQNPTDQPASELLKKIKAEKETLRQAQGDKKVKKDLPAGRAGKEFPTIKPEEIPFEIPENWVWCRLGEIGKITGGGTPSMGNDEYWNGNIPWVSPKDMWTEFVTDTEMKVTPKGIKESSTNLIPVGSLLIVGRSGILKRKLPVAINSVECTVNQDMKVIIPHLQIMNRFLQFMFWGLESIILKEYVKFGMIV